MNIKDRKVKNLISELSNVIRAENINAKNYLDLYVGDDILSSVANINNQVIYGRRGSGKTHLLKALQEKINASFESNRRLCIYLDAREILPLTAGISATQEEAALLIFQGIIQTLIDAVSINTRLIFGRDQIVINSPSHLDISNENIIQNHLKMINLELSGRNLKRLGSIAITEENNSNKELRVKLSKDPEIGASQNSSEKKTETKSDLRYVNIQDIATSFKALIDWLGLDRIVFLIDEWSEIPLDVQKHLAEIIKRVFISSKFSFKVCRHTKPNQSRPQDFREILWTGRWRRYIWIPTRQSIYI